MKIILRTLPILALLLVLLIVSAGSYTLGRRDMFLRDQQERLAELSLLAFQIRGGHPEKVLKSAEIEMGLAVQNIEFYKHWPGFVLAALDGWNSLRHPEEVVGLAPQALTIARMYVSRYGNSAVSPDAVAFLKSGDAK